MHEAITTFFSSEWLYTAFALIALGSTVVIILVILSENRNPVKSLAWVTVLLLLPVVGLILYLFFGRSIKNTRMISRRNRRKLRRREKKSSASPADMGLSAASIQQINLAGSLTGAQFYDNNNVEIFTDGVSKFKSLEADLRAARKSIHIQYYIFEDDRLGNRIAELLIAKVREGVKVRVIYDHVGSFGVKNRFFKFLRENGVEIYPFFKVTFPSLATRVNWRNHRKICIIDNKIGYIGGMNIADRYIDGGRKFERWRDTHLRVCGPVVDALQYSFAVDWNFMGRGLIEEDFNSKAEEAVATGTGSVGAQLLTSGPTSQWANIALAFHKAIATARRRVYIQTPYFLPTEALLKALQSAALAHVDVRIMMPETSDSAMLSLASASYVEQCLKAGIKIYFYTAGMLHSKMMIVDDEIVTIGSTNFDFRSFECNFEGNLFVYGSNFASAAIGVFKRDLADCRRIQPAQWRTRPMPQKFAESVVRLLSPIL